TACSPHRKLRKRARGIRCHSLRTFISIYNLSRQHYYHRWFVLRPPRRFHAGRKGTLAQLTLDTPPGGPPCFPRRVVCLREILSPQPTSTSGIDLRGLSLPSESPSGTSAAGPPNKACHAIDASPTLSTTPAANAVYPPLSSRPMTLPRLAKVKLSTEREKSE
ncbi:hypothetical protein BGY98DRAFT_964707, partial [Russula aff. rugulosa BPL654]